MFATIRDWRQRLSISMCLIYRASGQSPLSWGQFGVQRVLQRKFWIPIWKRRGVWHALMDSARIVTGKSKRFLRKQQRSDIGDPECDLITLFEIVMHSWDKKCLFSKSHWHPPRLSLMSSGLHCGGHFSKFPTWAYSDRESQEYTEGRPMYMREDILQRRLRPEIFETPPDSKNYCTFRVWENDKHFLGFRGLSRGTVHDVHVTYMYSMGTAIAAHMLAVAFRYPCMTL